MKARSAAPPRSLALQLAGMVIAVIAVVGTATPALTQSDGVRVTAVDTSDHPRVRLTVVANEPDLEAASVTQGGDSRPVTEADRAEGGIQLMLVVDASEDMADELRSIAAAATEFVLRLPADARVGVVVAGGEPHVAAAPTDDTGAVLAALAHVEADGEPALLPALPLALDAFTGGSGRRGVVLLAGDDHGDGGSLDDVAARLRAEGASLFGVGLAGGVMDELAATAGGAVVTLDSLEEADDGLRRVLDDLDHLYRVEFIASEEPGPAELSVAVGDRPEMWTTLTVPLSATDAEAREAATPEADQRPAGPAPAGEASAGAEPAGRGASVPAALALLGLVIGSGLLFLRRRAGGEPASDEPSALPDGGETDQREPPVNEPDTVDAGLADSWGVWQAPPEDVELELPEHHDARLRSDGPAVVVDEVSAPPETPPAPAQPSRPATAELREPNPGPADEAPEPHERGPDPGDEIPEPREPEPRSADAASPDALPEEQAPVEEEAPAEEGGGEPPAWHLPRWRPGQAHARTPQAGYPTLPAMLADALEDEADLPDTLRWAALTIETPEASTDTAADAAQRLADRLARGEDLGVALRALGTHQHEGVDWARAAVEVHRDLGGDLPELLRIADGAVTEQRTMSEEWALLRLESRVAFLALVLQPIVVGAFGGLVATGINAVGIGLLVAAAVLTAAGGWWLRRITRPPFDWRPSQWRRPRETRVEDATVLDLTAMAVAAGLGLPEALRRAASAWQPERAAQMLEVLRFRAGPASDDAAPADAAHAGDPQAVEPVIGLLRSESARLRRREIADLRAGIPRVRRAAVVPYLTCILPACILVLMALL